MASEAQKRRVFIVSPTESGMTARGNRHPLFASTFHSAGYGVTYLTTDFYHAERCRFSKEEIRRYRETTPYPCKVFRTFAYRTNVSVWRLLGCVRVAIVMGFYLVFACRRHDVLLVPSRPPEIVLMAAIVKAIRGVRLVLDVRDVWPDGLPLRNAPSHKAFCGYCNLLYRLSAGRGDLCLFTAAGFLDWIRKYSLADRALFVPLGYDKDRWAGSEPLAERNGKEVRFFYIGDLGHSMEIGDFVRAVACREAFSMTFIGGGDRLAEVQKIAEEMHARNIFFRGRVPKEAAVGEVRGRHVCVIPMKAEFVMPNKLFDAIGACRPVLVFGRNDASRFAVDQDVGWMLPFGQGKESQFLDTLTWESVCEKSRNMGAIRDRYSKEALYETAIRRICDQ